MCQYFNLTSKHLNLTLAGTCIDYTGWPRKNATLTISRKRGAKWKSRRCCVLSGPPCIKLISSFAMVITGDLYLMKGNYCLVKFARLIGKKDDATLSTLTEKLIHHAWMATIHTAIKSLHCNCCLWKYEIKIWLHFVAVRSHYKVTKWQLI